MKFIIKIAELKELKEVQLFFNEHINKETDGVINEEFVCPYGIMGAVRDNYIVIIKLNSKIYGALRFYPRKRDDIVSIYQFALDEKIRGRGIIKKMLLYTGYKNFESVCNTNSHFNNYYICSGWTLYRTNSKNNYWRLIL